MVTGRPLGEIDGLHPNNLRRLRLKAQRKLPEVAKLLGIGAVQAGRLERGRCPLTADYIDRLAPFLECETWHLVIDPAEQSLYRARSLLAKMSPAQADRWLRAGSVLVEATDLDSLFHLEKKSAGRTASGKKTTSEEE